ncbi:cupin domain-containing protein [Fibrella forsythiae]|uniref:Cupin domain-containing protein n=1 Tax=Fibrella forsythiae TaxID=2817061 RepID=A0ABS3JIR5_9BACT|nr:cupin domain-containing protein [Fibrella forsythiae]MBO0949898.1 cupin domain-containing protein [Fibrella forsythiae]
MKRRLFLQLPALASVAPLLLPSTAVASSEEPRKAIMVRAGEDRFANRFTFLDAQFDIKVSGKDTEGQFVVFDTLRPKKVGPPLHVHEKLDEWFWIVDGEFKFQAGDETLRLKPGDSLMIPKGMAHAFVKTSEGVARLIVMHQPAGKMEEYFLTASKLPDQSPEARRALAAQNDTHFVGPPLTPD